MAPLWEIRLDLEEEYKALVDDLIKASSVYFIVIFLYFHINPSKSKHVETAIFQLYSLIILAISAYHLVIKYLIEIV